MYCELARFSFAKKLLNWVDSWPGVIKWPVLFYIGSLLPAFIIGKQMRAIYDGLGFLFSFYLMPTIAFIVIPYYFPNLPVFHTIQFPIALQVWYTALPLVTVYNIKRFFDDVLNTSLGLLLDIPLIGWLLYDNTILLPLIAKAGFHAM